MKLFFAVILSLFLANSIFSQDSTKVVKTTRAVSAAKKVGINDLPLFEQFDYAISKSSTYDAYKVIKLTWMYQIKKNTRDSITALQADVDSALTQITSLRRQLSEYSKAKTEAEKALVQAQKESDSLSFMGALISKGNYKTIMWLLVFFLLGVSAIIFFLYQRSNKITVSTKQALKDKEEELETHRKWALEREQKLARELHRATQNTKYM